MKKIITSLMALFAIVMAAQAQTVLFENGNRHNQIVDDRTDFCGHRGKETHTTRSASHSDELRNEASNITLTTGKSVGETISLRIDAKESVEIDGATGVHINAEEVTYTLTNQTIVIRGEVKQFVCRNNKITAIDVSNATGLTWFDCGMNELTDLDVSKNAALFHLDCTNNKLGTLSLSKNAALEALHCFNNQLTSLNTGETPKLKSLYCHSNKLASLDLSKNTAMVILLCRDNLIEQLDLTKCVALKGLDCSQNQLKNLDLTQNASMVELWCTSNQLTKLDLPQNALLVRVNCSGNQLESVDVSKNPELKTFDCSANKLTALDISENSRLTRFDCFSNQIAGEKMDKLLASLAYYPDPVEPLGDEGFYVINSKDAQEKNICTDKQVAIAKNKGWKVYDFNGKWSNRQEYAGSPSSAEGIMGEKVKLVTEKEMIVVDAPTAGVTLWVFDLEGRCIAKQTMVAGENRVAVHTGYYVLNIGGFKGKVYVP